VGEAVYRLGQVIETFGNEARVRYTRS